MSPAIDNVAQGLAPRSGTVAPINQLFVVWNAVDRISREGEVIGPKERISPYEALKAVTVNVAYWYREEDRKGTLEVGEEVISRGSAIQNS